MKSNKAGIAGMVVAAFIAGCVVGALFMQSRINQREIRLAADPATSEQVKPVTSQPDPAPGKTAAPTSRSVIVNGKRLSDSEIETLTRIYHIQVRDGDYWYDRMNGSWGRRAGPTEGFIMAGLDLGGPLREDASSGDTGVFINGRQLHRVDVERLMLLGPVSQGRCWMDAQGNIGLEGQPPFANIWVAVRSLSGGSRKEGILSTYDKTGAAVIGGEVLMH